MKKLGFIIVIAVIFALTGCASSGNTAAQGDIPPFTVDLSTLSPLRNIEPFAPRPWQMHFIPFPEFPVDVTQFQRVTIRARYFDINGEEIPQGDEKVIVVLIYDPDGDRGGPPDGPGPNTPLKEFNVGGFSGQVSSDRGARVRLNRPLGGVMFQNNTADVSFVELTEITFHNGNR
jgi:hypothetical protein